MQHCKMTPLRAGNMRVMLQVPYHEYFTAALAMVRPRPQNALELADMIKKLQLQSPGKLAVPDPSTKLHERCRTLQAKRWAQLKHAPVHSAGFGKPKSNHQI